jgi:hypothetical protein
LDHRERKWQETRENRIIIGPKSLFIAKYSEDDQSKENARPEHVTGRKKNASNIRVENLEGE